MENIGNKNGLWELTELCKQEGILELDIMPGFESADLVDSGIIDSMGLLSLQTMIEEHYGVLIPQELFIMELRSLTSIAVYLDSHKLSQNQKQGLGVA